MYLYEDGMMQWSSTNSMASLQICDSEWKYPHPERELMLHTSIVTNSNVEEPGKYLFLYKSGEIYLPGIYVLKDIIKL